MEPVSPRPTSSFLTAPTLSLLPSWPQWTTRPAQTTVCPQYSRYSPKKSSLGTSSLKCSGIQFLVKIKYCDVYCLFLGTLSLPMSSHGWPTQSTPRMMTLLASNWLQVCVLHFSLNVQHWLYIYFYISRSVLSEPYGVGRLRHGDERDLRQEHCQPGREARHKGQGLQGGVVNCDNNYSCYVFINRVNERLWCWFCWIMNWLELSSPGPSPSPGPCPNRPPS